MSNGNGTGVNWARLREIIPENMPIIGSDKIGLVVREEQTGRLYRAIPGRNGGMPTYVPLGTVRYVDSFS